MAHNSISMYFFLQILCVNSAEVTVKTCMHMYFTIVTCALMTNGALSRNIGKIFSELKLVTNNLLFRHTYCKS